MPQSNSNSFLAQFNALPADKIPERLLLFIKWLRSEDRHQMFAELLAEQPVLPILPFFVLVSRWPAVTSALSQPETFTVAPHARSMDGSIGPYMLGRDNQAENWHEKSVLRAVLRREELPEIRKLASEFASTALKGSSKKIELVSTVSRAIPLRIVQEYFGFVGPDDDTMLRWSFATQHDMFRNLTGSPKVHKANVTACREMRRYLEAQMKERLKGNIKGDDSFARLLRLSQSDAKWLTDDQVIRNVTGLLVGTIETTSQAIIHAVEQILRGPGGHSDVKAAAIKAAEQGDAATLDAIVLEALRFNPPAPYVRRQVSVDTVLEPRTKHEFSIPAGTIVAPFVGAAMFDETVFNAPFEFDIERPKQDYLHFGLGHHECLGKYIALQVIPAVVEQVLLLPGLRLEEGPAGEIVFGDGGFPEQFSVSIN